jgi:DNA-binding transcriptional MocR family regulator
MAGLHLATRLTGRPVATGQPADQRIAAAARALGLRCDSASRFRLGVSRGAPRDAGALVFGYGQIEEAAIAPAIKRLAKLL